MCDLHIHTCLSPCADVEMSPLAVVQQALEKKLDIIAISDHNASENAGYAVKAARHSALTVLPGMEITTREEVHLLALFQDTAHLEALQNIVYANLHGRNDEKVFGSQVIANEFDEVEGFNDHLLFSAVQLGIKDLVGAIHDLNGVVIAAHIDRQWFSVISQLGFVPEDMNFDALEVSGLRRVPELCRQFPALEKRCFVTSSDAHFLKDIGRSPITLCMEAPTAEEILMAFSGRGGRCVAGAERI